jgi:hypothetical protein
VKIQEMFPVTPPSTAMSLSKDDDMGHDSAMSDDTRELMPCGEEGGEGIGQ